jgi:hypothetical protein
VTTPRFDFSATVVVLSEAEGGRRTPAHAGIRWDLAYADAPAGAVELFMIWPEFLDDTGEPMLHGTTLPVGVELKARFTIGVEAMRSFHRARLRIGTAFFCCEGARRVARGTVTSLQAP